MTDKIDASTVTTKAALLDFYDGSLAGTQAFVALLMTNFGIEPTQDEQGRLVDGDRALAEELVSRIDD